jgi:hypothetical protein
LIILRTASLIPRLLALALLVQAASAYGALPCVGEEHAHEIQPAVQMDAAHDAHSGHGDHAMHAPTGPDVHEHSDMSCCDDHGASACLASGHCLSASPLLPVLTLIVGPRSDLRSLSHELEWLPPYGAPSGPLFRPPIA